MWANKCEWNIPKKTTTTIFHSTFSLNGAQNIKLERQKFENESTQHKSLWTDYIYVTNEQKKWIKINK